MPTPRPENSSVMRSLRKPYRRRALAERVRAMLDSGFDRDS
jgi:hypothetical protein